MQTKYLIAFFVATTVAGMVAVIFFGLKPRAIPKINFSQFNSSEVVANSIFMSIPQEIAESSVVFWGADPNDPFFSDVLQKFLQFSQTLQLKFGAVVVDQAFGNLQMPPGLSIEQFPIRSEQERFLSGLQNVMSKKIHLLVVVPTMDASKKIEGSLINVVTMRLAAQQISKGQQTQNYPLGLVFSNFPRSRDQESQLQIPCNTGEEDRGEVASLGCLILQTGRGYYRKHLGKGKWVGLLEQTGGSEFLFLLTPEI